MAAGGSCARFAIDQRHDGFGFRLDRHHLVFLAVEVLEVDLHLPERDVDVLLLELAVDEAVDLVEHRVAVAEVAHVHAQFVVEGAFAEVQEVHVRFGFLEHPRVFPGGLEQQFLHQVQVRAVIDAELEGHPGDGVGQRPVDQLPGNERLVRDDDVLAVEVGDGGGADADLAHRARQVADGDGVADPHRAFEQDHDAGDEVGEDLLHAETQADRQRRHQPLQLVPAHAEGRQGRDETDAGDHIGQQRGGGVGAALGQVQLRQHQHFQQARQVARQGEGDADDDQRAEHVADADRHHAHVGAGAAGVFVEGDVVQVREHRDQVGPDPVQRGDEAAEQGQADQAQGLFVDLLDVQGRFFDDRFAVAGFLGRLAFGQGALVGQAPCRHAQAAHEGGFDHQPEHQQVQGVDQSVAEFQRGVVVAEAHGDEQGDGQRGEQHAHDFAEQRGVFVGRAADQQAAEQPGHQGVAGQHHRHAEHVIGQRRRLQFGNRHHGDQRHHHHAEAADPAAQEFDLGFFPAEMQFRHATRREDPVGGVEHQPGLGHLQQRRAHVGVLPAGVDLQGQAAQGQAQRHRHRQQDVDQDRLGRVPLAVALEVADVLVNLVQARIQAACVATAGRRSAAPAAGTAAGAGSGRRPVRSGLRPRAGYRPGVAGVPARCASIRGPAACCWESRTSAHRASPAGFARC